MQHWVKALYNDPGRSHAADWKSLKWVSDGPPSRPPRYMVGDELLLYDVPHRSFPARARVTKEPKARPLFVDRYGGSGKGKRWPHVTYVEVIAAVDSSVAPTPLMIDVPVTQGGHCELSRGLTPKLQPTCPVDFGRHGCARRSRVPCRSSRPPTNRLNNVSRSARGSPTGESSASWNASRVSCERKVTS